MFLSFSYPSLGFFFIVDSIFYNVDFCIFNLRRSPRPSLFQLFASFKYVLFSYYKTPEKRARWALI